MTNEEFKLRLQVLTMAKELALKEYYESLEETQKNWELRREKGPNRSGPVPDISFPDFPTTRDILEKASSLYAFVREGE